MRRCWGGALAGAGVDIYTAMEHISPQREASAHNITAKYSMEMASAREADCFTTVSEITATEAKNFLGRSPDVITAERPRYGAHPRPGGRPFRRTEVPGKAAGRRGPLPAREFPANTRIMLISGRYEFRNKGIDVFLEALGRLNTEQGPDETVLAFLFVLGGYTDLIPSLQSDTVRPDPANPPIATHRLHNEASDPILQACDRLGLRNLPQNRVQVIFSPAYLNGHDGLINMTYYDALAGCDLGIFPSYYEPWGYTPAGERGPCRPHGSRPTRPVSASGRKRWHANAKGSSSSSAWGRRPRRSRIISTVSCGTSSP